MKDVQFNNRVFIDAIAGVLLFIVALATVAVKTNFIAIPVTLAIAGAYFIYKSIKNDKFRIQQTN